MIKTETTTYDSTGKCRMVIYKSEKKAATFTLAYLNNGTFECNFIKKSKASFGKNTDITRKYKTMAEVKDWFEYIMGEKMI